MRPSFLFASLLVAAMVSVPAAAQLPGIQLHSLSQSVFAIGGEYDVHVAKGANTEEVTELRFSHPGIVAELQQDPPKPFAAAATPKHGHFKVKISSDVPAGRYEVRAVGRFGISNARSVLVAEKTQWVPTAGSDAQSAVAAATGTLVHRAASPQRRDFYSVTLPGGETSTIRVIASALDSRLIARLEVFDERGARFNSAIGAANADAKLSITPNEDRTVSIAISDMLYRGGSDFGYALEVSPGETRAVPAVLHPRCVSATTAEAKAVEDSRDAIPLPFPALIEAAFTSPDDRDAYEVTFQKGQVASVAAYSDRLGEPTDTRVIIEQGIDSGDQRTWKRIVDGDDSQGVTDQVVNLTSKDSSVRVTAPEAGTYRITVSDQDSGRSLGTTQRYRLAVGPPVDDWKLVAHARYSHKDPNVSPPAGVSLARGASLTISVLAVRNGYGGPIEVSIPTLPAKLTSTPALIAPNQSQTDLVIQAAEDAEAWIGEIDVVGKALAGADDSPRKAAIAQVVWGRDGQLPTIETRLTDRLMIAVSDQDICPLSVTPGNQSVEVAKGNKVKLPIKLTRREGSKENVVVRARGLPKGVKVGDLTIAKDKAEGEWTVDVTGGAAPGSYTFWGQAESKVKFAVNPQAQTRLTAYRDDLKKQRADPERAANHAALDQAIAEADKRIESAKKQSGPRDFTIYPATPLITLTIK